MHGNCFDRPLAGNRVMGAEEGKAMLDRDS